MTAHALLGASSAHMWLHCTPSARLCENMPDRAGKAAAEGTLAHEIAALKLQKYFTPMSPKAYTARMNKLKKQELYQDEMQGYTDEYLEYIKEIATGLPSAPCVAIEQRVDYSTYAPGGFGTADCILLHGDTLWVIDFKYGTGVPVEAVENEQMRLYALGALHEYSILYNIKQVVLTIFQPRNGGAKAWETTADEIVAWGIGFVKPRAELADKGEGDFCPSEDVCRFCRANAQCRARANKNLELLGYDFAAPNLLTNKDIGVILEKAQDLQGWVKDIQEYALKETLCGREVPGWKAVEGRSNRAFRDVDAAFAKLIDAGIDRELLYVRNPITLTATEKLVGKKQFEELLADEIEKPKGKPTLVKQDDKRPSYSTAADDFKEEIQ